MKNFDDNRTAVDDAKLCGRTALFGGAAAIVLVAVGGATFASTGGVLLLSAQMPFALGILFALGACVYGILAGNAARENEEKRLLAERPESRLLDSGEDARFTADRTFERYRLFAPYVIAAVAAMLSGGLLWKIYSALNELPETLLLRGDPLHLALVSALMMLFAVFTGVFFIGQSRAPGCRWLRPVGAEFVGGAALLALAAVAALAEYNGYSGTDLKIGRIVLALLALAAAEFVVYFAFEFYRPRTTGESRPLFESRLLGVFTEPGGAMRNFAATLDYQFGFRVSGTRIYTFAEKSFLPLLLFAAFVFWGSTAVHEVGPGERGFRTAFGRIIDREDLTPGIWLCLPWPFGSLQKLPTERLVETTVGESRGRDGKNAVREIVLWTELHGDENDHFIVAVPKDEETDAGNDSIAFIRMTIPIRYRVVDIRDHLVRHRDAARELRLLGQQTVTAYLACCSMDFILAASRRDAETAMQRELQRAADRAGLGVEIVSLSILDAHPPTGGKLDVAAAYQEVIGAMEQKETRILEADAYAAKTAPGTVAEARKKIAEAEAYEHQVKTVAAAESGRFASQLKTYRVMPEMFRLKAYLDLLESESSGIRKFIISSRLKDEVYELDLKENDRLDLLDAQIGELGK
ncbi:MAG: hypothetical protein MJ016_04400 [Victivallaceae bacterium]|nr:hypothetical protein [Victivallaceae bacterium]